jgi:hypothetical protein
MTAGPLSWASFWFAAFSPDTWSIPPLAERGIVPRKIWRWIQSAVIVPAALLLASCTSQQVPPTCLGPMPRIFTGLLKPRQRCRLEAFRPGTRLSARYLSNRMIKLWSRVPKRNSSLKRPPG